MLVFLRPEPGLREVAKEEGLLYLSFNVDDNYLLQTVMLLKCSA